MSVFADDDRYYTKNPQESCPECGRRMRPFSFDETFAQTHMDGVFYSCGDGCSYMELRKVTK